MDILKRLEEIVSDSDQFVLFEFGVCDGYHSNLMLEILSRSKKPFVYHGFEPVVELYKGVKLVYDANLGQTFLWNKAVGSSIGNVEFFKSGGYLIENGKVKDHYYGSSSIRKPKLVTTGWPSMTFEKRIVESTTFDAHLEAVRLKGKTVDFVWADIQGAEIDLISGGQNAFLNVRYFYTEYSNSEYYEGEIGLAEICKMLPNFEVIEDYGGDVLLKNTTFQ